MTVLRTSSGFSVCGELPSKRLDIVGREEAHESVHLSPPPIPVLLAQDCDHTALVEAELVRGLGRVGVEGQDKVLGARLRLGAVKDVQERLQA